MLWTRRRPRVSSPFHGAKVAVVTRVPAAPFRPLCDVSVNWAAVRPLWDPSHGDENQESDQQNAREDYALGSRTYRKGSFLLQETSVAYFGVEARLEPQPGPTGETRILIIAFCVGHLSGAFSFLEESSLCAGRFCSSI